MTEGKYVSFVALMILL